MAAGGPTGFGDMLDERLLRERIVWLEGEVRGLDGVCGMFAP